MQRRHILTFALAQLSFGTAQQSVAQALRGFVNVGMRNMINCPCNGLHPEAIRSPSPQLRITPPLRVHTSAGLVWEEVLEHAAILRGVHVVQDLGLGKSDALSSSNVHFPSSSLVRERCSRANACSSFLRSGRSPSQTSNYWS